MTDISMDLIKSLRDRTGISVMQCKKALVDAEGDFEKALVLLQKRSKEVAAKKQDRELGAGVISAYIHGNGGVGALVELLCETDFVSGNEDFKKLAYDIAMHAAAMNPEFKSDDAISPEARRAAQEVFAAEVADKPTEMKDKILSGKLESYFKDKVLLNQDFIKEPGKSIQQMLEEATQRFGERVEIGRFERYSIK
jgi:elongation factor Ts